MAPMSGKKWFLFILVFLNLHFSSCNQIEVVGDYFFGKEKKEATTDKKKKGPEKKTAEKGTTQETPPAKSPAGEPPKGPADEVGAPPSTVEKSPQPPLLSPPPFIPPPSRGRGRGEGPLQGGQGGILEETKGSSGTQEKALELLPTGHFGGNPTCLFSDARMLYAGFGRKLVFYDLALNEISSISLTAEIEKVVPQKGTPGNLIYVGEK